MKTKVLLWILGVAITLLLYNILCYKCVNMIISNNTKSAIYNYFSHKYNNLDFQYEYVRALNNNDGTISVFIKWQEDYYNVILSQYGNNYQVVLDNQNIPSFVKYRN